jgi:hypothetical protein
MQNELKISNSKIKLLEDTYVKKHKRKDYPETNVIYIYQIKRKMSENYIQF